MNRILWLSNLISFFTAISPVHSLDKPLAFDPYTLDIYDPQNKSELSRYAFACPDITPNEEKFNEMYSLDNKALFIRDLSTSDTSDETFRYLRCTRGIELAAVYHIQDDAKFVEFGYEVYFDKSKYPRNFETSEYSKFKKIGTKISAASKLFRATLKKSNSETDNLSFVWLSIVRVNYERSSWSISSLSYEIDGNINRLEAKCDLHEMSDILNEKNMSDENYIDTLKTFYSTDNQKEIFNDVELPSTLGSDCTEHYDCIKKYNLTPYNFHSSIPQKPSCSDLTSVPIWYKLNETLLDYLNKFLISISQTTKGKLTIHDGVLDKAFLLSNAGTEIRYIYLHPNEKKLPVPEIIYKIVLYDTYECNTQKNLCRFGVVIVIHNQPSSPPNKFKACEFDKCRDWGWDGIQYGNSKRTGIKSNYIQCCSLKAAERSSWNYNVDKSSVIHDLKLNDFPYFDGKLRKHRYENRQKEFENMVEKLFKTEDSEATSSNTTQNEGEQTVEAT